MTPRLLAAPAPAGASATHAAHLAAHGPLPTLGPADADALIAAVAGAGLRGRGGAGFPTARKLAAVAGARRPVVLVNGTEGEHASGKDRLLLTAQPHLVLDGAVAAARVSGARDIVVVAPAAAHGALGAALAERPADGPTVRLVAAAAGYVAGEETAVIAHVEGRPPRPRPTPPRPAEHGIDGRPTLVQNVETLAHQALVVRHGADWFRHEGTPERPGSTLVSVSGDVVRRRVLEVPVGTPTGALLTAAGGATEPLRAVLVGGYFGAWVDARSLPALADEALAPHGAAVGAGVLIALGRATCPVGATARLAAWMAGSSAGQCGSCVHGLAAIADALGRLAGPDGGPGDLARIERWTAMVDGRGACAHPSGTVRMARSAVQVFAAELHDHARHGSCDACAPTVLRRARGTAGAVR